MGHRYQSILETVGNTPVVRVNNIAPAGVDLYVKIEAFNPLGSVKDRLALGVIEAAEKSGGLKPGQTVIEGTSGHTGIGLPMGCAQKGDPTQRSSCANPRTRRCCRAARLSSAGLTGPRRRLTRSGSRIRCRAGAPILSRS